MGREGRNASAAPTAQPLLSRAAAIHLALAVDDSGLGGPVWKVHREESLPGRAAVRQPPGHTCKALTPCLGA